MLKLHPFSGGSIRLFWSKLADYGVEPAYFPRLLPALALSLLGEKDRARCRRQFQEQIESYQFQTDPVFILGHWRSGTTYLHHLMSQDERFSYVSSYQAFVPELFLKGSATSKFMVEKSLPKKRPMDNITLSMKKPEEEEFAMANLCPYSYIDTFSFPKHTRKIFHQSVLFEGLTPQERMDWGKTYERVLKMACLDMGGERPLLKSPGNTARIKLLLELFPNAKFIHLYRNPYVVFPSKVYTSLKLMEAWQFQTVSRAEVEENVLYIYEQTMKRYFEERQLIPAENLIEVCYEEFERDQLNTLEKIYRQFNISEFEQWKPKFDSYITARSGYKKNDHHLDEAMLERIERHWGFAIDAWGYHPPHLTAAMG